MDNTSGPSTSRKRKVKAEETSPSKPKRTKKTDRENTVTVKVKDEVKTEEETKPKRGRKPKEKVVVKIEDDFDEYDIKVDDGPSKVKRIKKEVKFEELEPEWEPHELLAEQSQLDFTISENIINLFAQGNTIPFIARYRKDATGNMTPEQLRDVKESYDDICALKSKISTVIKTVDKLGTLNPQLRKSIASVKTAEELELIYAPFKPGVKRTLAARAKDLGLEEPAMKLLESFEPVYLDNYINPDKKDLNTLEDVEKGIGHIIASVVSTNTEVLTFLRNLRYRTQLYLESKNSTVKSESKTKKVENGKPVDEMKFEPYFNFKMSIKFMKPHQILAINRGEHLKVLTVKIIIPEHVSYDFFNFCRNKWAKLGSNSPDRMRIINNAFKDCYTRLIQPLITREVRAELKAKAEKASYDVFAKNLKHLLLAPPLRGKPILAIDPGYSNGCKLAIVSETGALLDHGVIYPHTKKSSGEHVLKNMILNHNCGLIVIGNGTACRQTETWLADLIQSGFFKPMDVQFAIVGEEGASIYSCGAEAKKEFPDLDPNIISAISLARRTQDPLAELVKIEPQHLGVGMYQHDLKKKTLDEALHEVVSECVSFVGVDLNTASQCLLRRIAGLSDKRATEIINHREKIGGFSYRKQLMDVKGIGVKVFEQCAGFLRVGPVDAKDAVSFYKQPKTTKLDCTIIHPESYDLTKKVLKKLKLDIKNVGEPSLIASIQARSCELLKMHEEFDTTPETMQIILDGLSKPLNYDMRVEISSSPLFKKDITSITEIGIDSILTGRVNNVTHFGCFVDIGVGSNGLIHSSKLMGFDLQVGDRVEVKVVSLDIGRKRIGLQAVQKL